MFYGHWSLEPVGLISRSESYPSLAQPARWIGTRAEDALSKGRLRQTSHTLSSCGAYRLEMISARSKAGLLPLINKRPVTKGSGYARQLLVRVR